MNIIVLIARLLFAGSLLALGINNLTQPKEMAQYAASKGVPASQILVPISGLLILLGSLSIALGLFPRVGALLILLFLLPVTPMMHDFWNLSDPSARQNQQIHFWKNVALIGGALLLLYFGSGPLSLTDPLLVLS